MPMAFSPKYFRSRVDLFTLTVVLGPIALIVWLTGIDNVLAMVIMGSVLIVITVMLLGTGYRVYQEYLIIKVGPVLYSRIPIRNIKSARRSYNPIGSPAASLRRLELNINRNHTIYISPVRERQFLTLLKSMNPEFKVLGILREKGY